MYFKRLELIGFKSFADKTVLNFEPGVTAVVGPNGCGKSNVFDSVRWVLGEQSVKALRGADMQDVIFNGTDKREPLSLAEVTLAFDNTNKFFAVDHDEVAITRRIFRNGESEYLLNKTQVRLKDILDLLMGTGIGAESYSLVQQGKIDLVLSSRPEDRRLVFDEASGITKYKAQKREALRKLEETEQNLLRVNDIILEVKRQIGSLERQANKARRYKEVFEELKAKEIKLALIQKDALQKQKDELFNTLKELEVKETELSAAIKEQESRVLSHHDELKSAEDNISKIKLEISNLENMLSRDSQHIAFNKERIIELESSKAYLATQVEQINSRLLQSQEKLDKLRQEYNALDKNIADKTAVLKEHEAELAKITAAIRLSLENIADAKKNILDLAAKISNAHNTINTLLSKQQVMLARKKRLDIERAKVNEEKNTVEGNLNNINQEVADLERDFAQLSLKLSEIKKELETENLSIKNIDSDIEDLERQNLSLLSQKEFLGKLKTEYDGIGESMNAVIYLDKLPQEKMSGLVIKVNAYPEAGNTEDPDHSQSGGFKLAGEAKPIDLDTQKISERIDQIQMKIDSLKVVKRVKESHKDTLDKDLLTSQELLRAQELALANKKAYQHTILEQFEKIRAEEELITLELTDVDNELAGFDGDVSRYQLELAELEKADGSARDAVINEENSISISNKLKEDSLIAITQIKTELDDLNRRINTDAANLKMMDEAYAQDQANLVALDAQIKDSLLRGQSLAAEISDLDTRVNQAKQTIQEKSGILGQAQSQYKMLADESSGIVEKTEADRKAMDEMKTQMYELQMSIKDVDFKYLNIKERLLQAYKTDLDSTLVPAQDPNGAVAEVVQVDVNALTQDIQRLKDKLDSYGNVNLIAIEEYDELKQRYDFLTQQQTDLVSAKESLHQAILKINRTTKQMFLETFEKVKVEFKNYFRLLFNGGDAQVFLTDESDPLESGIEVICRPPGKKLQNVLLLSGGEKSMAAVALIFAIFKVKPAPFCILDEIDAALDEANVDRFGKILQEFAKGSQFIVITHNKKTIANASVMYGITMEQSGVSKIVSVKFSQDKKPEVNDSLGRAEAKDLDTEIVEDSV